MDMSYLNYVQCVYLHGSAFAEEALSALFPECSYDNHPK